jgi:group I intron endonuclease
MENCGIYIINNKINGKAYVGQSRNIKRRIYKHKNDLRNNRNLNEHLQSSYNKYGIENFKFYTILECSIEELNDKEIEVIKILKEGNIKLYNMDDGGKYKFNINEETIKKMSESAKKRIQGYSKEKREERIRKYINTCKNRTEEQRIELSKKLSDLGKKRFNNMSEEEYKEQCKKCSESWKNMNKEYKKEIGKKRSYLTKKRWKNMELKQKKYIGKKISEEAKKRWDNMTQEKREEISKKMSESAKKRHYKDKHD